jgi:hypothetical protein
MAKISNSFLVRASLVVLVALLCIQFQQVEAKVIAETTDFNNNIDEIVSVTKTTIKHTTVRQKMINK